MADTHEDLEHLLTAAAGIEEPLQFGLLDPCPPLDDGRRQRDRRPAVILFAVVSLTGERCF